MEVNLRKPQPRNGKATLLREEKAVKSEGRPLLSLRLSKSGIPDDAVHTPDSPYGFQKHLHLPKDGYSKSPLSKILSIRAGSMRRPARQKGVLRVLLEFSCTDDVSVPTLPTECLAIGEHP